ncbi:hypothetical protein PGB90_003743 [Kerria lacca]
MCVSVEDDQRTGRPSTVIADNTNAAIIAALLDEDRRITVREIEEETGISKSSAQRIPTSVLGKKKFLLVGYLIS